MYALTRSGLTLKITDTNTNSVQYFQQPNVTLNPAQVDGNPIDSVTFKGNGQITTLQVKNIASINGAAPAATLDEVMEQIMNLLATTGAAPVLTSSGHFLVSTSNVDGTAYQSLANQDCSQLTVINTTGYDLDFIQQGSVPNITILNGKEFTFRGIANANVLAVRRNDRSETPINVRFRWEK